MCFYTCGLMQTRLCILLHISDNILYLVSVLSVSIVIVGILAVIGVYFRPVYPMLPVSLDCPFFIVPSVFSNVYLFITYSIMIADLTLHSTIFHIYFKTIEPRESHCSCYMTKTNKAKTQHNMCWTPLLSFRDRPFNLQRVGLWFFFSFRNFFVE
jgi:hypothetical protein